MTASRDYLAALERRKIESGGTLIPSLDEWGELVNLTWAELEAQGQKMNYQQSFEPRRRPSQRHDYHRLPVHGSHAMRTNNTRKYAFPVAMGILAVIVVLMLVL